MIRANSIKLQENINKAVALGWNELPDQIKMETKINRLV